LSTKTFGCETMLFFSGYLACGEVLMAHRERNESTAM